MTGLNVKQLKWTAVVVIALAAAVGCGSHKTTGAPSAPIKITLTPSGTTSLQQGTILAFTATAQNSSNTTIGATFTFISSDTSILNVAPGGAACAGHWDAAYANCTPGGTGPVLVTASADGATSASTLVFVHPPIDNITVAGVLLNGIPIQQPCLSQGQSMTVEAHAFSQGTDITSSVGPFTWSASNNNSALNITVVKLTPLLTDITINNQPYPIAIATNQATATAVTPGITQISAVASGTSSTSFAQPPPGTNLNFFETCPIQNITLELGQAGSGQTSFAATKGSSAAETVVATVTDVMGNSSLPNTDSGIVLSKIPLTWTSSQPQAVGIGTGCTESCTLTLPSAGAAAVTASCSPPTCNIGFGPQAPPGSIPPLPVYATTAISGLVTGATSSASVLATSMGCADTPPQDCSASIYTVGTAQASAGAASALPFPPNSLLFDRQGDKAYMGSEFGVQIINPGNLGGTASPFTSLGTVTGKPLATSPNGLVTVFSDTVHAPNQVYVTNTTFSPTTTTALNISGATAAAFSPDGLKAYIFGFDSNGNPNLFVYSTLQALQTTCWSSAPGACPPFQPANTTVSSIAFSTNGAFAYVAEPELGGVGPAVSVYNTCNDEVFTDTIKGRNYIPLTAPPIAFKALPDGLHFIALEEGGYVDYISANITGIPTATLTNPSNTLCPMTVGHTVQSLNLGQGDISPINFFVSPDGTLLYVVASGRNSVLIYNLAGTAKGVQLIPAGGIPLAPTGGNPNPTPISADMSIDSGIIAIAASDGYLHLLHTALGGSDQAQVSFPNLPNFLNPFCTFTPATGACTLDLVAVRP